MWRRLLLFQENVSILGVGPKSLGWTWAYMLWYRKFKGAKGKEQRSYFSWNYMAHFSLVFSLEKKGSFWLSRYNQELCTPLKVLVFWANRVEGRRIFTIIHLFFKVKPKNKMLIKFSPPISLKDLLLGTIRYFPLTKYGHLTSVWLLYRHWYGVRCCTRCINSCLQLRVSSSFPIPLYR